FSLFDLVLVEVVTGFLVARLFKTVPGLALAEAQAVCRRPFVVTCAFHFFTCVTKVDEVAHPWPRRSPDAYLFGSGLAPCSASNVPIAWQHAEGRWAKPCDGERPLPECSIARIGHRTQFFSFTG